MWVRGIYHAPPSGNSQPATGYWLLATDTVKRTRRTRGRRMTRNGEADVDRRSHRDRVAADERPVHAVGGFRRRERVAAARELTQRGAVERLPAVLTLRPPVASRRWN